MNTLVQQESTRIVAVCADRCKCSKEAGEQVNINVGQFFS
jgi:hypothetical protein